MIHILIKFHLPIRRHQTTNSESHCVNLKPKKKYHFIKRDMFWISNYLTSFHGLNKSNTSAPQSCTSATLPVVLRSTAMFITSVGKIGQLGLERYTVSHTQNM